MARPTDMEAAALLKFQPSRAVSSVRLVTKREIVFMAAGNLLGPRSSRPILILVPLVNNVVSVTPDTPVRKIASLLVEHRIGAYR